MKMLLRELVTKERLKDILRRLIPLTMQDVFARKIFANHNAQAPLGAIQITAADICAAVDLFREGKLPKSSFIRQEQVALPDFLANRYGSDDQQSAQVESIG
jgi:type III secretory pathway lipoprotein EscJ